MTTNEADRQRAAGVVAEFIRNGERLPSGTLPLELRDAITTALSAVREEERTTQKELWFALDRQHGECGDGFPGHRQQPYRGCCNTCKLLSRTSPIRAPVEGEGE